MAGIRQMMVCLFLPFLAFSQKPKASFTIARQEGCAPFSVDFTNTSGGAVSYYWIFGNGNFSSLKDPQNVFVEPGTYTVKLIAVAADGSRDTAEYQNFIKAMPGPVASFTLNDLKGCVGSTLFRFSNTSSGAVSYFWDFGDGTSSLDENPEKIYETTGPRAIKLKATNVGGCQTVYKLPSDIQIFPIPKAGFSSDILQTCNPSQAFNFSPENAQEKSYLWEFGDGSVSTEPKPSKIFPSPGIFSVKLIVENAGGCRDSLSKESYVEIFKPLSPKIIASDSGGCIPFMPKISTDIEDASKYNWDFGNGQKSNTKIFSPLYKEVGKYAIRLTITSGNGCSYSTLANSIIEVFPDPQPAFSIENIRGCVPLITTFKNTSAGAAEYLWDFGDKTESADVAPIKTYLKAGKYNVRLKAISEKGCASTFQFNSSIDAISPQASFTESASSGCPPFKVQLTNNSTGADSYKWIFGDGTSSSEVNPTKTFDSVGVYDVILIAGNSEGCNDTLRKKALISVNYEQATYTPPEPVKGCAPFTASFKNNDPNAIDFLWDFGDGKTSAEKNPTHTYEKPGVYKVSLLVNQGGVCKKSYPVFQEIIVEGGAPLFEVNIDPCPPHAVSFRDTTTGAVSWEWDFGDGTKSTEQNPSHLYENTNIYHVTLKTTTSGGCENKYIAFNAVNFARIMASFKTVAQPGPFPKAVKFINTTPNARSWNWDFGDGSKSNEENPIHVYQTEGDFKVTLTVNGDSCEKKGEGSAFTDEQKATTQSPEDSITGGSFRPETYIREEPLSGCAPVKITFFKQDTTHNVVMWSFGDGETSELPLPQHIYKAPGIYSVFYVIRTASGLDTILYPHSISIGGRPPEFGLVQEDFCNHSTVRVSIMDSGYKKISWSFGGKAPVTGDSAKYDFPLSVSANTILLHVEDTLGCKSSHLKSIYTNPPLPEIVYPSAVCNDSVKFNQLIANPAGYNFSWDFGDGNTSTEFEPVHYYKKNGTYIVQVAITDPKGCVFNYTLPQQVKFANPKASYEILDPLSGCAPLLVRMQYNGDDNAYWEWNNAPGAEGKNMVFKGNTAGKTAINLVVKSNLVQGCSAKVHIPDTIEVFHAKADFGISQQTQCYPLAATFSDLSPDAVSWNWDFGNGVTSDQKNPVITFLSQPADSFSLKIINSKGCSARIKKKGLTLFKASILAEYKGTCNPLSVKFKAAPQENIEWTWYFGDNSFSSGSSVTHIYRENGSFRPFVIGKDKDGCRDTAYLSKPLTASKPKALFDSPTPSGCAPSVVTFVNNSVDALNYKWDFGDGSFSTVKNPVKLYEKPGLYSVKLIAVSAGGCSDTLMLSDYVKVLGPATTFKFRKEELCSKTLVYFTDQSIEARQWEWNFGEGHKSDSQHPVFTYHKAGNYTISLFSKDSIGCSAFYSVKIPVEIHPFPSASFSTDKVKGCTPLEISAENKSEGAIKYFWNYAGLDSSGQINGKYTFSQPGDYFIELIAETDWKCRDTFRVDHIKALVTPKANMLVSETSGCSPLKVLFKSDVSGTENPFYAWNLGDGSKSNEENPLKIYPLPGLYDVKLLVRNANGCSDSVSKPSLIEVFDTIPPPVSPIMRVTVENETSVRIEWSQSFVSDFRSYTIYRKKEGEVVYKPVQSVYDAHVSSFLDKGLNTLDFVYCYKIEVTDRCGYVIKQDDNSAHCTVNIESKTNADNTIDLVWTPYKGKIVSQYRLFRKEESGSVTEEIGIVPGTVTNFRDTGIFCPVSYRYFLRAEGLNGQWHVESSSDYDIALPIQNLFTDQQVDASRATVVNDSVILTEWAAPKVMANRVNGYRILRSTDNQHFQEIAKVPAYQKSYLDENVDVDHQKYYYRIFATNACGLEGRKGQFSDNIVLQASQSELFKVQLRWTHYEGWGKNGVGFYIIEKQGPDGSWEFVNQTLGEVNSIVDEN